MPSGSRNRITVHIVEDGAITTTPDIVLDEGVSSGFTGPAWFPGATLALDQEKHSPEVTDLLKTLLSEASAQTAPEASFREDGTRGQSVASGSGSSAVKQAVVTHYGSTYLSGSTLLQEVTVCLCTLNFKSADKNYKYQELTKRPLEFTTVKADADITLATGHWLTDYVDTAGVAPNAVPVKIAAGTAGEEKWLVAADE